MRGGGSAVCGGNQHHLHNRASLLCLPRSGDLFHVFQVFQHDVLHTWPVFTAGKFVLCGTFHKEVYLTIQINQSINQRLINRSINQSIVLSKHWVNDLQLCTQNSLFFCCRLLWVECGMRYRVPWWAPVKNRPPKCPAWLTATATRKSSRFVWLFKQKAFFLLRFGPLDTRAVQENGSCPSNQSDFFPPKLMPCI